MAVMLSGDIFGTKLRPKTILAMPEVIHEIGFQTEGRLLRRRYRLSGAANLRTCRREIPRRTSKLTGYGFFLELEPIHRCVDS